MVRNRRTKDKKTALDYISAPTLRPGLAEAPLIAELTVPCRGATEVLARIGQGDDVWTLRFSASDGPYLLLGLHPEGVARVTVQITDGETAVTWDEELRH